MNLLIDQREQSDEPETGWPPQSVEMPASPLTEEPMAPPAAETPLDYYNFDETEGRKRGILGPVLIILFLLAAIVAAAYYGFFYKPQELEGTSSTTLKTMQQSLPPVQQEPPTASEPVSGDEMATSEPAPERTAALPPPAPETAAPAAGERAPMTPSPSAALSGDSPLAKATALLDGILSARPAAVKVTTLILDQNSFSAEVSADGRPAIENFAAALKTSIPGGLSSAPSSGYYSGVRALVSGTFPGINPEAQALLDEKGLAQVKQTLRNAAPDAGLKVIEISQSKEVVRGTEAWVPIFTKVSGSEEQFEKYCMSLAAQLPQLRLEKIILLSSTPEKAVGVIRLEAQIR